MKKSLTNKFQIGNLLDVGEFIINLRDFSQTHIYNWIFKRIIMLKLAGLLIVSIAVIFLIPNALAYEPIMITISDQMLYLDLDGRWTHPTEWKKSSLNEFTYDDQTKIILRTAHQGDFVYVFLDALSDRTLDRNSDRAIICFDSQNDKTLIPDKNDYCFMSVLESHSFSLQGGTPFAVNGYFGKIEKHENTTIFSSISDINDRYSKSPHPSFEFKIPIEIIQRNNIYGFYFQVFDATSNKIYSYPTDIEHTNPLGIPSPSKWGEIISPDKSLPEFDLPLLSLISIISFTIILTKIKTPWSRIHI